MRMHVDNGKVRVAVQLQNGYRLLERGEVERFIAERQARLAAKAAKKRREND
jgi:hypothetical protein